MDKNVKRCSRCILPQNYPNITFDSNGVCNICHDYDKQWGNVDFDQLNQELEKRFTKARKLKRKYDCVVPLSGGRDSTYVLYQARTKFDLKVLAVTHDNGFFSDYAKDNIRKAVDKLNVDHIMVKTKWPLIKSLYRCFFMKAGEFCTPCNISAKSSVIRVAKSEKVPLIIYGSSPRTDEASPYELCCSRMDYFKNVIKDDFSLSEVHGFLHKKNQPSIIDRAKYKLFGWPEIALPGFMDWNHDQIFKTLRDELGWEKSDQVDHMDCIMDPVKDYIRLKKFGFSALTQKLSALIRDGQMARETALAQIALEETGNEPEILPEFLKRLDLSREEFEGFVNRTHLDYFKI